MKGRERKMLITILTLFVLLVISTCGWFQSDVQKHEGVRRYTELKRMYFAESERNLEYERIIARKTQVIAELERIKGVAVSEVTYYAPTGNNTATGVAPEAGKTVAVDPSLIPLGSEVYIEGLGWRNAEDTGGAINGSDLDVFVNSESEAQRGGVDHLRIIWRAPND